MAEFDLIARIRSRAASRDDVVLGIGDELNDIEMIRWAGYGVAMGNALPEVRRAAHAVTAHHEHDGLALVLEALVTEVTAS